MLSCVWSGVAWQCVVSCCVMFHVMFRVMFIFLCVLLFIHFYKMVQVHTKICLGGW